MKVLLGVAALICCVSGQHHSAGQYRVVEHNDVHQHPQVFPLPTAFPFVTPQPQAGLPQSTHHQQYNIPQYSYSYGVHDPSNGDVKGHSETRHGDVVSGSYTVMEADGTVRIVEYTADAVHGFNAIVRNTPITHNELQPQSHGSIYPQSQRPFLYHQAYSSNSISPQSRNLGYAPSAQVVSPSNEISYVITYQTPSSQQQYTLEQSDNAFVLNRVAPSSSPQSTTQTHQTNQSERDQQGTYYHFRMTHNQPTLSPQALSTNSAQGTSRRQHATYNDHSQQPSSLVIRQSVPTGLPSNSNQRVSSQHRSSGPDYLRSQPPVTAYPTATPAYNY